MQRIAHINQQITSGVMLHTSNRHKHTLGM